MSESEQLDLLSNVDGLDLTRWLLADLHDDLRGKVARFRQLTDLSTALGSSGTMMPGGEKTHRAWNEARTSFIHGNYIATVLLCQGLAEHILAAELDIALGGEQLPHKIAFNETLRRSLDHGIISDREEVDLQRLMELRNPLSHYRNINDPTNLSRRVMESMIAVEQHLFEDAVFAIGVAVRLLALPFFRLGKPINAYMR